MAYVYSSGEKCWIGDINDTKPIATSGEKLVEYDPINGVKNVFLNDGTIWIFKGQTDISTSPNVDFENGLINGINTQINKTLENSISNRHWADLTDNFTYTSSKYVRKLPGQNIEYVSLAGFSYSEQIAVTPGEIWRTVDYSITPQGNWTANARGILLDSNSNYVMDMPCKDIHSINNTFEIPIGVAKMIYNKKSTTRIFKVVDWVNVFNPATSAYVLDKYVNNSNVVVDSTFYGYATIPVIPGEIYRIADVFGAKGDTVPCRGVFVDGNDNLIKVVKYHQIPPLHWNDVLVPPGAVNMKVDFLKSLNGIPDGLNRLSINKAITPTLIYKDNSKLKNKVLCALGDSITWYHEWLQEIANATELTVYNHGYSSGSIAENGRADDATYPVLNYDAKIDAIIANNPDIVTIMGGVNDKSYDIAIGNDNNLYATMGTEVKTTYIGGYCYIIKKLLTWKPTLKIIIMTPSGAGGDSPNGISLLSLAYADAAKKIATFFGLQCVDIRGLMNLNYFTMRQLTRDNVHDTFRGADFKAQEIEKEIRKINWILN